METLKKSNYIMREINGLYHSISARLGLSDSAMLVLYTLCELGDECLQSHIYKMAGTSRQTINSAIRKLEREGILFLKAGPGRNTCVCLTEQGRRLVGNTVERLRKAERAVYESWSESDRNELLRLSRQYLDGLREKAEDL